MTNQDPHKPRGVHLGVVMPPPPPEIPPGWYLAPPDFVGVGTMKSGTTWWWSVLKSHPDVIDPVK
jgi:hypothetical protein